MAHGLAFSSLAALAPRILVLRISRRSLSLAPRNAIKYPVFYYLGPASRHTQRTQRLAGRGKEGSGVALVLRWLRPIGHCGAAVGEAGKEWIDDGSCDTCLSLENVRFSCNTPRAGLD